MNIKDWFNKNKGESPWDDDKRAIFSMIAKKHGLLYNTDDATTHVGQLASESGLLESNLDPMGATVRAFQAAFVSKANGVDDNYTIAVLVANSEVLRGENLSLGSLNMLASEYASMALNHWGASDIVLAGRAHFINKSGFLTDMKAQSNAFLETTATIMAVKEAVDMQGLPDFLKEMIGNSLGDFDEKLQLLEEDSVHLYEAWAKYVKPILENEYKNTPLIENIEHIENVKGLNVPHGLYVAAMVGIMTAVSTGLFEGKTQSLLDMVSELREAGALEHVKVGNHDGTVMVDQGSKSFDFDFKMEEVFTEEALDFFKGLGEDES